MTAEQLADTIASKACQQAKAQLGSKFEKQLGSMAACKAKIDVQATKLAKDALAKCQSASDQEACARREVEKNAASLQTALRSGAAGANAGEIADEITDRACQAAKGKLGSKFEKQLGSLEACTGKIKADATKLAKDAIAKCKDAKDLEGCIRQLVETDAVSLQFALGSGAEPSAEQLGDEIAGEACLSGKEQAGANQFAKKYPTIDACKAKIRADATKLAKQALSTCEKASDQDGCVRQAVKKDADSLQSKLGVGSPSDDIRIVKACAEGLLIRYTDCETGKSVALDVAKVAGTRSFVSPDGKSFKPLIQGGKGTYTFYVWLNNSDKEFAVVKWDGPTNVATLTADATKRDWTIERHSTGPYPYTVYVPGAR